MKKFDIALVEAEVNKFLAVEGYHFAHENMPEEEVLSEIFGVRILSEKSILVCGFDEEEGMYYVSSISGSLKKGYEFDYDSYWYDEKEEALEFMAAFGKKAKKSA